MAAAGLGAAAVGEGTVKEASKVATDLIQALSKPVIGWSRETRFVSEEGHRETIEKTTVQVTGLELVAGLGLFGLWEVGMTFAHGMASADPMQWSLNIAKDIEGWLGAKESGTAPPAPTTSLFGFLETQGILHTGNVVASFQTWVQQNMKKVQV